MSEIVTLWLQKLSAACELPELPSKALSDLVSKQSAVLEFQSKQVKQLSAQVSMLSEQVSMLSERVEALMHRLPE